MTTLNGAKFLGRESSMGSVAEGKDANLVLLDANPIASVQNLHRIAGVVRAGAYHSAADLAAMKQKTADRVAAGIAMTMPPRPPCC
jgi:cytosine/adenosine deaminase-related metal-dependent hydrolase